MKRRIILIELVAMTLLLLAATPGPAAEPQFKWKAQTLWSAQETPTRCSNSWPRT